MSSFWEKIVCIYSFMDTPKILGFRARGKYIDSTKEKKKDILFSICACHPCAGAML